VGYLGFTPDEQRKDGNGVLVVATKPGAPADLGGLKKGDLITAVDGKAITGLEQMDGILAKAKVGQKMRMTVDRSGKLVSLNLTLGRRPAKPAAGIGAPSLTEPAPITPATPPAEEPPTGESTTPLVTSEPSLDPPAVEPPAAEPPLAGDTEPAAPIRSRPLLAPPTDDPAASEEPAPRSSFLPGDAAPLDPSIDSAAEPGDAPTSGKPSLGITVIPLNEEARALYGLSIQRGALITGVRPGSPADTAGLPVGGVVVAIDGRKIESADDLVAAIRDGRPGQEVELTYFVGEEISRKSVRLGAAGSATVPAPSDAAGEPPLSFGPPRSDRPNLGRVEGAIDGFTRSRGASTVYDPSEMSALRDNVLRLEELVQTLQDRVKALEGKSGEPGPAVVPPGEEPAAP
jgi:hypothetical protein